ncbi:unnamed protein product [Symbiodinium natans]|uniref:Uncharacterized protein n=1 Tax=Symbiodinium natans TaxID=878477 RepID=A0A812I7M6_9DINO|nr:unnamed protein product [Symbiodinium natans]
MAEEASTGETKEAANVGAALDEGKTAEPGLRGVEDAGDAPGSSLPCEEAVHDALHLQDSAVTGEEGQLTYPEIASGSSPTKPIAESIEPVGAGAASYRGAPATQITRDPPGTGPPSHAAFLPHGYAATGPPSQPTQGMADDSRLQAMAEEASTGETKEAANVGAALDEGKTAEPGLRGVEDAGDAPGSSLPCEEAVHDALHLQDSAVTGEEGQLTYLDIASGSSPTKPIAESIEPIGAGAASYRGAPATTQVSRHPPGTGPPSHAAFLPQATVAPKPSTHTAAAVGCAATGPSSQPTRGMADDSRLQAMAEEASTGETKAAANVGGALDEGKTAEPGLRGMADAGDAPSSSLPCEVTGNEDRLGMLEEQQLQAALMLSLQTPADESPSHKEHSNPLAELEQQASCQTRASAPIAATEQLEAQQSRDRESSHDAGAAIGWAVGSEPVGGTESEDRKPAQLLSPAEQNVLMESLLQDQDQPHWLSQVAGDLQEPTWTARGGLPEPEEEPAEALAQVARTAASAQLQDRPDIKHEMSWCSWTALESRADEVPCEAASSEGVRSYPETRPILRDVTSPKPRKTLSFSDVVELREFNPNARQEAAFVDREAREEVPKSAGASQAHKPDSGCLEAGEGIVPHEARVADPGDSAGAVREAEHESISLHPSSHKELQLAPEPSSHIAPTRTLQQQATGPSTHVTPTPSALTWQDHRSQGIADGAGEEDARGAAVRALPAARLEASGGETQALGRTADEPGLQGLADAGDAPVSINIASASFPNRNVTANITPIDAASLSGPPVTWNTGPASNLNPSSHKALQPAPKPSTHMGSTRTLQPQATGPPTPVTPTPSALTWQNHRSQGIADGAGEEDARGAAVRALPAARLEASDGETQALGKTADEPGLQGLADAGDAPVSINIASASFPNRNATANITPIDAASLSGPPVTWNTGPASNLNPSSHKALQLAPKPSSHTTPTRTLQPQATGPSTNVTPTPSTLAWQNHRSQGINGAGEEDARGAAVRALPASEGETQTLGKTADKPGLQGLAHAPASTNIASVSSPNHNLAAENKVTPTDAPSWSGPPATHHLGSSHRALQQATLAANPSTYTNSYGDLQPQATQGRPFAPTLATERSSLQPKSAAAALQPSEPSVLARWDLPASTDGAFRWEPSARHDEAEKERQPQAETKRQEEAKKKEEAEKAYADEAARYKAEEEKKKVEEEEAKSKRQAQEQKKKESPETRRQQDAKKKEVAEKARVDRAEAAAKCRSEEEKKPEAEAKRQEQAKKKDEPEKVAAKCQAEKKPQAEAEKAHTQEAASHKVQNEKQKVEEEEAEAKRQQDAKKEQPKRARAEAAEKKRPEAQAKRQEEVKKKEEPKKVHTEDSAKRKVEEKQRTQEDRLDMLEEQQLQVALRRSLHSPSLEEAKPVHADRRRRHSVRAQDVREEAKPNQRPPLLKREVAWSQTLLEGTPPFQVPFQPFQSATEMAVGINGACGSAAGSVSTKPAPRPSPSPLPSALRDASRARPMRTLRFSEIVEQRDISPNPRSVSGSDGSGCDRPRAGQADPQPPLPPKAARRVPKISQLPTPQSGPAGSAASSKTSADSKPAPVQSSSFAEFLFFQPSPEAPSPHLSSFLFAADSAASESNLDTAAEPMKHAAQANQNALRSARHHHQSEIQHKHHSHHSHSTAADDRPAAGKQGKHGKHHQQGRTTRTGSTGTVPSSCHGSTPPVGDCGGVERVCSPPVHVTDAMARRAHERGLSPSLQKRVLERAYFLFENGESDDSERNYFKALRIELSQSG